MDAKRTLNFGFKVKKATKGSLVIEGLANANTIDRMKERILPSAWNLDNYKKNPVVLFDHGHDPTFGYMPVGKALSVEPTEEGLYTKIELSSSKTEKISAVRDLVEEGILKTFSVGFDPKASQKSADDPDVMEITKAELIETSIVPIPMNQDSTFTMLSKRKAYWQTPLAKKWYDVFMDRVELHQRKAWVAAAVHQRLHDLIEVGEIRSKEAALKFVAEEAGVPPMTVKRALTGRIVPMPEQLVKSFATVLRVSVKTLSDLNTGNYELLEKIMARADEAEGGETVLTQKGEGYDDEKKPAKKAMGKICCIVVDKASVESMDAAAAKVEAAGYATDAGEETDQGYVFWQEPKEQAGDLSDALALELGDGVYAYVTPVGPSEEEEVEEPEGTDQEMSKDDQKAMDDEGKKEDDEKQLTEDEVAAAKEALAKYEEERAATNEGGEGNPAAWVADEAKWEKAKEMAKAAEADDVFAFAVWAYLNVLGGGKKGGDAQSTKNIDGTDDNPYLKMAETQTAMLGAILNELKGMGAGLKGLADLTVALSKEAGDQKGDETVDDEGKDVQDSKSLDLLLNYQRDLDKRLKKLKV